MRRLAIFLLFFSAPLGAAAASEIAINEVFFDPSGTDTGLEWIEIYNSGDAPQDLSGWQLYPDGIGYFSFSQGFQLMAKSFVLVRLRATGSDSAGELFYASPSSNMGNTSGSAALFSGEPRGKDTIKSFVQWGRAGETWETDAEKAGFWTKGVFIEPSGFAEGNSVALAADGINAGGAASWKIASNPTPGSSNVQNLYYPNPTPAASSSPLNQSYFSPAVNAYAGEDKTVISGASAEFIGYASGFNGKFLENAGYFWNFGDGAAKEGRSVSHIFQIPGRYLAGLHVSAGEYAASDYALIDVVPNRIAISGVTPGEEGFIKIVNPSAYNLDIGGWVIEDGGGKKFVIPAKTMIAAGVEVFFANNITGLLQDKNSRPSAIFRYPNLTAAFKFNGQKELFSDENAEGKSGSGGAQSESAGAMSKALSSPAAEEIVSETPALSAAENINKSAGISAGANKANLFFLLAVAVGISAAAGFLALKRFGV